MRSVIPVTTLVGVCMAFTPVGCSHDWDTLDPRLGPTSMGGTGPSGGSGGAAGGTGGATGGAPGGTGGIPIGGQGGGGMGGAPPALVDDGLLTRYYLDEAATGTAPLEAQDAAPSPLDLPLSYAATMTYDEVNGQRGLSWPGAGLDGGAGIMAAGTKVDVLHGSTSGTIEVVVALQASSPSSSRLSHFGTDTNPGSFTLFSDTAGDVGFDWSPLNGLTGTAELWPVDFLARGRVVLHCVLDTTEADAADRLVLYVNGVAQPDQSALGNPPLADDQIQLLATDMYYLGNRAVGLRSFEGTLFYAALYETALTASQVAENAAILLADDDTP